MQLGTLSSKKKAEEKVLCVFFVVVVRGGGGSDDGVECRALLARKSRTERRKVDEVNPCDERKEAKPTN